MSSLYGRKFRALVEKQDGPLVVLTVRADQFPAEIAVGQVVVASIMYISRPAGEATSLPPGFGMKPEEVPEFEM